MPMQTCQVAPESIHQSSLVGLIMLPNKVNTISLGSFSTSSRFGHWALQCPFCPHSKHPIFAFLLYIFCLWIACPSLSTFYISTWRFSLFCHHGAGAFFSFFLLFLKHQNCRKRTHAQIMIRTIQQSQTEYHEGGRLLGMTIALLTADKSLATRAMFHMIHHT